MREPDKVGAARAWKLDGAALKAATDGVEADVVTWIVNGPYHPVWAWWQVGVITLDDVPGFPPANKQYPEAEWEFSITSLQAGPGCDRKTVDIDALERGDLDAVPGFLTPQDAVVHFHAVTREQAATICELAVNAIVAGHSCDSDFRFWWKNAITKTVEHYVLGVHS
jgi:hypothetical protein